MRPYDFGCAVARFTEKRAGGMFKALGNAAAAAGSAAPAAAKPVNAAATAAGGVKPVARIGGSGTPLLMHPKDVVHSNPSWLRHNNAVQAGLDPATGLRPGASVAAPPPPPVPPVPPRATPRDNQASRGFDLLRAAGGLRTP